MPQVAGHPAGGMAILTGAARVIGAMAALAATVFASLVSHRMFGRSLFDVQVAGRGLDFSLGRDRARPASSRVLDPVSDGTVTARPDEAPEIVTARLAADDDTAPAQSPFQKFSCCFIGLRVSAGEKPSAARCRSIGQARRRSRRQP